jgi:uncharacterized membrane protein YfcA
MRLRPFPNDAVSPILPAVRWSTEAALLLCLLGIGVGAFGTLIGAGGGFILTPILLLLYPHDSAETLTAISLAVVFFNAVSGSIAYGRQRRIDLRSGVIFALATLPGAVAGALVVGGVSRHTFDALMGGLLGVLALWLLLGERWSLPLPQTHLERRRLTDRFGNEYAYAVPVRRGVLFSLAVGFVSSFFGIGGGVMQVPLLVRALGFPMHVATATSQLVLAIMAGGGSLTHVALGSFSHGHGLRRTAALTVGVIGGAQLGAHVSLRLRGTTIQALLAAALIALSARLLFDL